jgi:hypothetical protein
MPQSRFLTPLIYLLMTCVAGIPAVHKLLGDFPPEWFQRSFEPSLFGKIPNGVVVAFACVLLIEVLTALLFARLLVGELFRKPAGQGWVQAAFGSALLMFLVLFFGSFLIENYDNGFKDFVYFAATYYLYTQAITRNFNSNL